MPSSHKHLSISGFKFGVEIELGIYGDVFHDEVELPDGWTSHDEHCGVEVVSPPLMGRKGLLSVRECLRRIWNAFDTIEFNDCGFHVHIDIQHFTLRNAKRLLKLGSRFDEVIYSIMDPARYQNYFCRHVNYDDKSIDACRSLNDFFELQGGERYRGINMLAFSKHGTVEFRYARGTASWRIIYSLISMYMRMIAFAESDIDIPTVDFPTWNGAGPNFQRKKLEALSRAKDTFFDLLEIRGGVRAVLNEMFEKNHHHAKDERMGWSSLEKKKKFPSTKRIQFETGLRTRD